MEHKVLVRDVPLFQGIDDQGLRQIETCLHQKSFHKGELLFHEGAGCERVFIVRHGRVNLFRTSASGREQILESLGPGDTCACNPGNVTWFCSASAQAVTDSQVWFLSRMDYVKLVAANSQLARTLNTIFAKRLQCFTSLIEEVSLKDARMRLIKFLIDMVEQERKEGKENADTIPLPFTREEIAQRLGATRETVARYLSQLQTGKYIELLPHKIIIKDESGLRKILR